VAVIIMLLVLLALSMFGVIRLTCPEPNAPPRVRRRRVCIAARWLTIAWLALCVSSLLPLWLPGGFWWLGAVISPLGVLAFPACAVCLLVWLRRLAGRARKAGLATLSTVLMWFIIISGGGTLLSIGVDVYAAFTSLPPRTGRPPASGYATTTSPALPATQPGGAGSTAAVTFSPATMPGGMPVLFFLMGAIMLVSFLLGAASYVIWIILLFWYRSVLGVAVRRGALEGGRQR
jgi:hypothetical protein